ncbi:MAG: PEP-CTERM sorting domain-containing protein [Planctomycetota bacterium]|nr:PEP-CTERM sorting domain-containing protein [Planctomycetota bacterium]
MKSMIALAALVVAAGAAQAATVAYWAFPATVPSSSTNYNITWPINADLKANAGLATLDTDASKYDGSASPTAVQQGNMQLFTGTTVNLQSSYVAGSDLRMRSLNGIANGKSIIMRFDASGFQDLVLSYAERSTSTGATSAQVFYSTDGTNYTAAVSSYAITADSTYRLRTVDLSSIGAIEFASTVYLKITFNGFSATSPSGNTAVDNVLIDGTFIPAPGSLALVGLGGLVAARRRRA